VCLLQSKTVQAMNVINWFVKSKWFGKGIFLRNMFFSFALNVNQSNAIKPTLADCNVSIINQAYGISYVVSLITKWYFSVRIIVVVQDRRAILFLSEDHDWIVKSRPNSSNMADEFWKLEFLSLHLGDHLI
jgi:hypothetical protein